jgi:hypothetical protein
MDYIPDYAEQYDAHEARQERLLKKYPKCCHCRERITDDEFYNIKGDYYHTECCDSEFLVSTEDYMED